MLSCLPRQDEPQVSCSVALFGEPPLPVGGYQEMELQELCRRGAGLALPSRSPAGRLPSPWRHLSNTEFISMSTPEATALGGQLKQHDRSFLPVSPLQSEDAMLGEGWWGFCGCSIVSL